MMNEQMRQAEDRIHRIGQLVSIPIDEYIRRYQEERAILDRILEETTR